MSVPHRARAQPSKPAASPSGRTGAPAARSGKLASWAATRAPGGTARGAESPALDAAQPATPPPVAAAAGTGEMPHGIAAVPGSGGNPGTPTGPRLGSGALGAGIPLPPDQRTRMEAVLGGDLSGVRLHTGASAARMAWTHGALAVAEGQHVAFGAGQYRPGTVWGEAVLAHELAHARQQQHATSGSSASAGLEREADQAGLIAALRLLDPARAAHLARPTLSPGGLQLQRCAPPDYSDIEMLPTRAEYEERGELVRREFTGGPLISLDPMGGLIALEPGTGLPSGQLDLQFSRAPAGRAASEETSLAGHPNPIAENFGASTEPMTPQQIVLRLSTMEVLAGQIARLVEGVGAVGSEAQVAQFVIAGTSRQQLLGAAWPTLVLWVGTPDPQDVVPTEPAPLSREVVRSERALGRIYDSLVELGADRQQELATGRALAESSKERPGRDYDVDDAVASIDVVRRGYLEAAASVLTPRMIRRFNAADDEHGRLGPELLRRKLEYYQSLTASVPGIEDTMGQINDWAGRLQIDLVALQEESGHLRAAREAKSPDLPELEARFLDKADLIATSLEALGEWDRAVQAYEFLLGNSALWGFAGADRIAIRLEQMKNAAYDGDAAYLKLLLRDHRADAKVQEYFESLPSIVMWSQFIIMMAITLIAAVAAAGVGIAFAAGATAAFGAAGLSASAAGLAGKLVVSAVWIARLGGEALAFTIISRALSSSFPGLEPKSKAWHDFLWNAALFGALKGVARAMRSPIFTLGVGRFERVAISSMFTYQTLQAYGLIRFQFEEKRAMTADEFRTMSWQNALMMVGIGLAMKPLQPVFARLEGKVALANFRSAYGPRFAEIEAARAQLTEDTNARMQQSPEATPEDIADLRGRAQELDTRLRFLVEEAMNDRSVDPDLVRQEAAEIFGRLERTPLPEVLRQAGLDPGFELMPAGREADWSFPRGRADALLTFLKTAGYEVLADVSTSGGRVIEAVVPGKGRALFIERPSTERVVFPLGEGEVATARRHAAEDVAAGGTRGRDVYPLAAAPTQTPASVGKALRGLRAGLAKEGVHLEVTGTSGDNVTGRVRVDVPATATTPATVVEASVEVTVVPELAPGGVHGAEAGHARLSIEGDATSGWKLRIQIDGRLTTQDDVQHNLRHELREGGFSLVDLARGASRLDVALGQGARVFRPGAETEPSPHDRAAAPELRDLFNELHRALRDYEGARRAAAGRRGREIPASVRDAGEIARRRLDAALDAMGFQDPTTRAAKRGALLDMLSEAETSALAEYVDSYGRRTEAAVARRAQLDRLSASDRERLRTGLGPGLAEHLGDRVPEAAIDPLNQAMGRGDPANNVRNVLRELLRQHRGGRLSDQQLIDIVQRLEFMLRDYGAQMREPAQANSIQRELQTDPQDALGALGRLEARIVQEGITETPAAAPAAGQVRFRPEPELTGRGTHGIGWPEADARARAAVAEPDQGRFGTLGDVWYAVQCARQLAPPGHGAAAAVFFLPPGHGNVVFRHGVPGTITPDVVFVQVRPGGEVHAYPAVSTGTAFRMAHLGAVRPVVTW